MTPRQIAAAAVVALATFAGAAQAQWQGIAAQNAAFDQQFNAQLGALQQQNQAYGMRIWQHHLQVNGPRLQREYAQLRAAGYAVGTFEQYAYWSLMTAGGTNVQGAVQAQRDQFEGQQRANRTVQEGHASYNAGWAANSARQSAAAANYTTQAIRGEAPYRDPSTGRTTMLPHHLPQGQTVQVNGQTYAQDRSGQYYRYENQGWVPMTAAR